MKKIEQLLLLKKLREEGRSFSEISVITNLSLRVVEYNCANNCKIIKQRLKKELENEEYEKLICKIISESNNINQVCIKLGIKSVNNNYNKIRNIIKKYNIDTTHFCFSNTTHKKIYQSIDDYFTKDSKISSSKIKDKILKNNIRPHKCEMCGQTEWKINNEIFPIPLQAHHIDGDRSNNTLENIQILCPNCHSFTDNFCRRKHKQNKDMCYFNPKEISLKKCPHCEKTFEVKYKEQIYCSKQCASFSKRKVVRPTKDELEKLISQKSYTKIGQMFSVSDNTIRKWCKKYGILK